jgi:hypothetical protein
MKSASETRARVQPLRLGAGPRVGTGTTAVEGVEARVVDGDIGALLIDASIKLWVKKICARDLIRW